MQDVNIRKLEDELYEQIEALTQEKIKIKEYFEYSGPLLEKMLTNISREISDKIARLIEIHNTPKDAL